MIKLPVSLFLLAVILPLTACNNQRNNRLSAANACDSGVRAEDPTAYGLTELEIEREIFDSVTTDEFPDNEALSVSSVVTTIEVPLANEEKATVRVLITNPASDNISVQCVLNISLDTVIEKTVAIPVSNANGLLNFKEFKITIGNPSREDKSDFIRLEEITENLVVATNDDVLEPLPFSDFFSADADEFQFFKLKVDPDKEVSEEDRLKESFFVHYKNDVERVRSRMTVSRILEK